jgi:poly-gamma-glutamate capsule biosynthesis protein CapA/YwtB (metallophosphatase superfamily)
MSIRIALGGDVNFSRHRGQIACLVKREFPSFPLRLLRKLASRIPFPVTGYHSSYDRICRILLPEYGGYWQNPEPEKNPGDNYGLPFREIGGFFRRADIGYVNLETPLSPRGRHVGSFCSSPNYAKILIQNNIRLVSIANNHAFDAGEEGLLDTIRVLNEHRVHFAGGGTDIGSARNGVVVTVKGLKLGILGYTATCNSFFISLVKEDQPGILPLYEPMVLEDIAAIKKRCDFLLVAPHFDTENVSRIHQNSMVLAHRMIDQGADLIIGSHSHIPKPIELYKGKIIIYSLGNLIFTYSARAWGDNLVAAITISESGRIEGARFFPVQGRDLCFSPKLRVDKQGDRLLDQIRRMSRKKFGVNMECRDHYLEIRDFVSD